MKSCLVDEYGIGSGVCQEKSPLALSRKERENGNWKATTPCTIFGFPENKGLASLLGVSESAASKLVRRAEEKLGVANRGQLVRLLTVLSGFGERERWRREALETERRAQRGGAEKTT